jgi:hypothetical protein
MKRSILLTSCAALAIATGALAEPNPLHNAYFGETHMHTALSLDAYIGGTRLLPSDSYRFAKGEPMVVNGRIKQLDRPLDFAAVTDHAEYLGEMVTTMFPDAPGHLDETIVELRNLQSMKEKQEWFFKYVVSNTRGANPQHPPFWQGEDTTRSGWQIIIDAAEEHNDPGNFTALIGFEWSAAPGGGNMHRNVIFRDSVVPDLPLDSWTTSKVEELWQWLDQVEAAGSTVLAIPHNSNASKGLMFPEVDSYGDPVDAEWVTASNKWEPLIEMMQIKGNSEVHRAFWTADEFADFENADSIQKNSERWFTKNNFVREGLKIGLAYEQELGTNPFQMGFIGGTDSHNGLSSDVIESDFIGGHGPEDGLLSQRRGPGVGGWVEGPDLSIGSIAGVWAEENTRAAIWDAMKRRETFVTSGPRMKVRMFAGDALNAAPADPIAMVEDGYASGVPMGAILPEGTATPVFTVYAEKDVVGANLDRVQIIKGWVDVEGETHERIIDVAWSGDRTPNAKGKLSAVGNTVDVTTAMYTNDIGSATLMGSWTDPDFDPAQGAFYYARVLEIPTPRWSTYDAVRNGLPLQPEVAATIQERAWSSPIWHIPAG